MRAWHRRSRRQPPVMSENETGWIISIKVHPPVCSSALTPCQGRNSCAPAEQFDDPPLHFCPQEQHTRHVFNLQTVFLMFSPPPPPKKWWSFHLDMSLSCSATASSVVRFSRFTLFLHAAFIFLFVFSLAALTRYFTVWHRASLTTPVLLVALKSTLPQHCTMIKAIQRHAQRGGRIKTFFFVGFFFFFFFQTSFNTDGRMHMHIFLLLLLCGTLDFSLLSRWAPPILNTVPAVTSY